MIGIIVATPLQLFNSMLIMRHHYNNEKCVLFVLDIACDMHPYIDKYRVSSIIYDVFYLDKIFIHHNIFGLLWDHLHETKRQKRVLLKIYKNKYSCLLTTWVGTSSSWLFSRLKKRNPDMRIHFYEEGVGIYVKSLFIRTRKERMLYRLLGNRFDEDHIERLYMYKPEMCKSRNSSLKRVPIGSPDKNDNIFIKYINKGEKVYHYSSKVLYFESNFQDFNTRDIDENIIISMIAKIIGNDNLLVRTHPRTNPNYCSSHGFQIDKNLGTNWEYILSQNVFSDNTVLISPFSSALFTPCMIYGMEPQIIIIGKCIQNENPNLNGAKYLWNEFFSEMCDMLISIYKDKTRVMIPKNYSELFGMLQSL